MTVVIGWKGNRNRTGPDQSISQANVVKPPTATSPFSVVLALEDELRETPQIPFV